jgi:hypothetical protein
VSQTPAAYLGEVEGVNEFGVGAEGDLLDDGDLAEEVLLDRDGLLLVEDVVVHGLEVCQDLLLRQVAVGAEQLQVEVALVDLTLGHDGALVEVLDAKAVELLSAQSRAVKAYSFIE